MRGKGGFPIRLDKIREVLLWRRMGGESGCAVYLASGTWKKSVERMDNHIYEPLENPLIRQSYDRNSKTQSMLLLD